MSTKNYGNIHIVGEDFSWIEENRQSLAQPEKLDENVQIVLRLRKCMKERGWSQKELAAALGVSPQHVNKVLRNQEPTFSVKVAAEYGRKLNYPLIKVCSDTDDVRGYFSQRSVLSLQEVFSAADLWSIREERTNGFVFIPQAIPFNHRKNVSTSKMMPFYA